MINPYIRIMYFIYMASYCINSMINFKYIIMHLSIIHNTSQKSIIKYMTLSYNLLLWLTHTHAHYKTHQDTYIVHLSCYNSRSSVNRERKFMPLSTPMPPATKMVLLLSGTAQWPTLPILMSPTETHWFLAVM